MFQTLKEKLKNPKSKKKWYDLTGRIEARRMIKKSLSDGRTILEYLNSFNVPVYIVLGNWTKDKEAKWNYLKKDHYKELIKGLNNIIDVHHKIIDAGDYQFIDHGISSGPEYPQYKKDLSRFTQKELVKKKKKYDKLYNKVDKLFMKASKPVIFLSHNVPFNTTIDVILNRESGRYGQHFGSLIAREMIDKHQPLVCTGGHMHEHFKKCKLGRTTCINSWYGSNVNVWLELEGSKIKKLEFHKEIINEIN